MTLLANKKKTLKNLVTNIALFVLVATVGFYSVKVLEYLTESPRLMKNDNSKYYANINEDEILFYSTAWCSVCEETRLFLKKNKFLYIERDIEKNIVWAEHIEELNTNAVPLLIIGDYIVYGFRPALIEKYYESTLIHKKLRIN
ncbi:MAG: glutaredoxin family protein [Kangiellaceae bacterium]|nr:glutaredoxin family protein [Kangiellaceae bacterium]